MSSSAARGALFLMIVPLCTAFNTPATTRFEASKIVSSRSVRRSGVQPLRMNYIDDRVQDIKEGEDKTFYNRRKMVFGAASIGAALSGADYAFAGASAVGAVTVAKTVEDSIDSAKANSVPTEIYKPANALRGNVLQGSVPVSAALRYSEFAPKLANLCDELGFAMDNTLPSRAFCSDENQLYPILELTKNFACPPFDHGRVGGVVATDRHGPHAAHGKDLVLVSASHVGYVPGAEGQPGEWGKYRRMPTEDDHVSTSCGMVAGTLAWYSSKYEDAQKRIRIIPAIVKERVNKRGKTKSEVVAAAKIRIPTDLLNPDRPEGLFLKMDKLTKGGPLGRAAAFQEYTLSDELAAAIKDSNDPLTPVVGAKPEGEAKEALGWASDENAGRAIGGFLRADAFEFKKKQLDRNEPNYFLERHLLANIQEIVTSAAPFLTAALAASQLEFERTVATLVGNPLYKGKNLMYVAGVNIDVSPGKSSSNILGDTMFLPVASLLIDSAGKRYTMQAKPLTAALERQPTENPLAVSFDAAVKMTNSLPKPELYLKGSCGCPSCTCSSS